jgi:TonB family protein
MTFYLRRLFFLTHRHARILFIYSCIFPPCSCFYAQTSKFPTIDLSQDIATVPEPVLFKTPISHYEIIFETDNHQGFDTAQWISEYYDNKGQLLRKETDYFSNPNKVGINEPEGKVGRVIGSAKAERYVYDAQGNVTDEMDDRVFPANSIAAFVSIISPMALMHLHSSLPPKKDAATEEKYVKHYLDSVINQKLAGSMQLDDSLHSVYDANMNPLVRVSTIKYYSIKYSYTKNGNISIQRILHRISDRTGRINFFPLEERHVNYNKGLIRSIKIYQVSGDSTAIITSDSRPVRSQTNYYNKQALTDSIIFHELDYILKHSITYNTEGLPVSHLVLKYRKYDSPAHWDTLFNVKYTYAKGKLSELLQQDYIAGKRNGFADKEYTYNEKDQPLEMLEYFGINSSNDQKGLFRKHRFYYVVTPSPTAALPRVSFDPEALYVQSEDEARMPLPATQAPPVEETPQVFTIVEQMPAFNGDLADYLSKNLRYPETAQKEHRQGKVIVQFIVKADGRIRQPKILKGANADLNEESLRLIMNMPAWKPGKNNGHEVDTYFTLPVSFRLD